MKILYLLRHAKSSWGDPALADFDRPLNERGRRAAPLVAKLMRERGIRPGLVICSPAARARETAELVAGAEGVDAPIRFDERIYEAHPLDLLKVVRGADEAVAELMIVGHNPGLEELTERLTGERERLPTAALVRIELKADGWARVEENCGRLDWVVTPREIDDD
ncbi:MAG: histidine phosphatase family protein [Acidobacteria bacterium]|nr:histidine phosphatase family protein [Acidobacteriota bacterium]